MIHPVISDFLREAPLSTKTRASTLCCLERLVTQMEGEQNGWSSLLTEDGFPVEFRDSTGDHAFRYTVEPAFRLSSIGPDAFLEKVTKEFGAIEAVDLVDEWARSVRPEELRWGCWIGYRHEAERATFKLYLECPGSEASSIKPAAPAWLPSGARLRMIGVDFSSAAREYYYRVDLLTWESLNRLLQPHDLFQQNGAFFDLLETLLGSRTDDLMPGKGYGFSFSMTEDEMPCRFSLFAPVRRFFGPDDHLADAVPAYCSARGTSMKYLEAALRAWHGAIVWGFAALSPARDGIRLDIGFAPAGPDAVK